MVRISAPFSRAGKILFPAVWFGLNGVAIISIFFGDSDRSPAFALLPSALIIFGFAIFRVTLWDLVDEVQDGGDHLLVRNGAHVDRISLNDVTRITEISNRPPRIVIAYRGPGNARAEFAFVPAGITFFPFTRKSVLVDDLRARVSDSRATRTG